jgi:hypothetical protein
MNRLISTWLVSLVFAAVFACPFWADAQSTEDDELEASIVEDADDGPDEVAAVATNSSKTTESTNARDVAAGERRPGGDSSLRFTDPRIYRLKVVVRVEAPDETPLKNVVAVAPLPRDWPEQKVRLLSRKVSEGAKYKEFDKAGQCKTFNFQIPEIAAGETAGVELLYEITRWRIVYSADDDDELSLPHGAPREVREQFNGPAPGLEMKHPKIKNLTRDLKKEYEEEGAWKMIKGFWQWTRDNVAFKNGDFRGALFAVEEQCGDCEEMSALFVSMCRLSGGVARSVWVEGHNYPEFYLLDKQGHGHWIPAQVVGPAWFGEMVEYRPIFQKGDRFFDPFKHEYVRYAPQTVKAEGKAEPKLVVEHQIISDQDIMAPDYRNPKMVR